MAGVVLLEVTAMQTGMRTRTVTILIHCPRSRRHRHARDHARDDLRLAVMSVWGVRLQERSPPSRTMPWNSPMILCVQPKGEKMVVKTKIW